MIRTAPGSSIDRPMADGSRLRIAAILALIILGFIAAVMMVGMDWSEGPAMVLGELLGMLAPLMVVGAAILILSALWRRPHSH